MPTKQRLCYIFHKKTLMQQADKVMQAWWILHHIIYASTWISNWEMFYSCPDLPLYSQTFEVIMHIPPPIIDVNMYFQHLSAYVPSHHCSLPILKSGLRNALHLPSGTSYTQSAAPYPLWGLFICVSNHMFALEWLLWLGWILKDKSIFKV